MLVIILLSEVVTLWCTELPSVGWTDLFSRRWDWGLSDPADECITWVWWWCRLWVRMCFVDWHWVSVWTSWITLKSMCGFLWLICWYGFRFLKFEVVTFAKFSTSFFELRRYSHAIYNNRFHLSLSFLHVVSFHFLVLTFTGVNIDCGLKSCLLVSWIWMINWIRSWNLISSTPHQSAPERNRIKYFLENLK